MDHADKAEVAAVAAKVAPPSIVTAATFLGYPIEHWILWLTFAWWVWLFAEKIHGKFMARRQKRRRRSDKA